MIGLVSRAIAEMRRDRPDIPELHGGIVAGIDALASAKTTIIFLDTSGKPAVVSKIARSPDAEASLEREHEALSGLHTGSPSLEQVPTSLGLVRIAGRLVLLSTGLDGEPMMTRYYARGHTDNRAKVEADFRAAFAWLGAFQNEMLSGTVSLSDAAAEWMHLFLDDYRIQIGWSAEEESLFSDVAERARELAHLPIPISAVHGDYWMGNLLVEGGRVTGVIDWERALLNGLPFSDVYKFPTSYGFYLDRASHGSGRRTAHPGRDRLRPQWLKYGSWPNLIGFAYAYFGRGWFPDLVRNSIGTHLELLGIPPAANRVFFPLFLADQALALPDPSFREGYRSALRALWIERETTWLWQDGNERPLIAHRRGQVAASSPRAAGSGD